MSDKQMTINDIAKMAGVSKATISRFLNGHFERMSEDTRTKIDQIIKTSGYRINQQAKALTDKQTHLIGMVVADIENIFSSMLFKGADQIFQESGYQIILMNSNNSLDQEQKQLERLLSLRVDGIILQPVSEMASHYQFIKDTGTAMVIVDRKLTPQSWPEITTDNYGYSQLLGNFIVRMGYQRIVMIGEKIIDNSARTERYSAIKDIVNKAGISAKLIEIDRSTSDSDIYNLLMALSDNLENRTAVYALKGTILMRVIAILSQYHVAVPGQLGVVAFDDWDWSKLVQPQITTIQQNPQVMGKKSARRLINMLENDNMKIDTTLIESSLKVRDSLVDYHKSKSI
uniref:LacI family DNA-binding transcriptional regulator n=1 Tax=Lentilactobacillus hilgardii TaxID=1588 RepID=UPI00403F7ADE